MHYDGIERLNHESARKRAAMKTGNVHWVCRSAGVGHRNLIQREFPGSAGGISLQAPRTRNAGTALRFVGTYCNGVEGSEVGGMDVGAAPMLGTLVLLAGKPMLPAFPPRY